MPLYKKIKFNDATQIYIWKIEESFEELHDNIKLNQKSLLRLNGMKSEIHRRGFLSVRKLLQEAGYSDFDLSYNADGKPYLKGNNYISISHSYEYATIIISDKPTGIDLEIVKEKTLKIASRFMNINHLEALSHKDKIKKATVIWGIKETIFKIKNEKGISFTDHIFENSFNLNDKNAIAQLQFNNQVEKFRIHFDEIENYILVYAFHIEST